MSTRIGRVTLLVPDQDAAIEFYREAFGFTVLADLQLEAGFRALHVGPGAVGDPGIWLFPARSEDPLGRQTGSAPALVLYTDELDSTLARTVAAGGSVLRPVKGEGATRFAHVRDLVGTEIMLVEGVT